jgi:hypothetical protein
MQGKREDEFSSSAWKPKLAADIRDLAREYSRQAIERLVALMHSKTDSVGGSRRGAEAERNEALFFIHQYRFIYELIIDGSWTKPVFS